MLVEFLNPAKFPKVWNKHVATEPETVINISFNSRRIGLSTALIRALNVLDTDFTHVQLATRQVSNEDRTMTTTYYLVPCKKDGWPLTVNQKSKTFCFSSTSLVMHLKKSWNIDENVSRIKVPIFLEPQDLNGVKCLQINLKHIIITKKK